MAYNHYNNDLPVPPHGYANWRAFYADSLAAFSALGDQIEPHNGRILAPAGGDRLAEIPYWKIAHYAAREQAEYDAKHPLPKAGELMELRSSLLNAKGMPAASAWLELKIEEAIELEDRYA